MRFVKGFLRFWFDFIVGDDWRVAAGVVAALAIGGILVALEVGNDGAITLLALGALVAGLVAGLDSERRKVAHRT